MNDTAPGNRPGTTATTPYRSRTKLTEVNIRFYSYSYEYVLITSN